jgi:lactoylglutathione lyase
MRIEHIAIWTNNLEELKEFYVAYFQAQASAKYVNPAKQFESYFLTFPSGQVRLELMRTPALSKSLDDTGAQATGYAHLAFSVGSEEQVDALTAQLQEHGLLLVDGPRYTGDGYYESCVLDPDGNRIEITI